ncbi:MAG TPA: ATP-binding protein [Bryobacteraceae bacterium]|nr:ATP-binding protein [Bryobacteraceae bacterium]
MNAPDTEKHEGEVHSGRPAMLSVSLKTRLRVFIIVAMISVVSALSFLYLQRISWSAFDSVGERAERASHDVMNYVVNRTSEAVNQSTSENLSLDDYKRAWADLITHDDALQSFLLGTLTNSKIIVEILIADENGQVLASTVHARVGRTVPPLPDFADWSKRSHWGRLSEIFTERRDYEVSLPLGVPEQPRMFDIRVILSSVLLRDMIFPQVRDVLLIFLAALMVSMLMAVVVSNLALRPLQRISIAIDDITKGELGRQPITADTTAREFAAVQSKLKLLGQQYHGARQDALQLRSNVEQLLEKLEEVVFLFDRDDRLVMAGRAAERFFGRGRWEILGRSLTELFPAGSPLGAAVRNSIDLRQPVRDLSLTLERNGVQPTRVLLNVEPLERFPEHNRMGTLITLRDAETRRQIQSQLDVSARLAAISRLTSGVAHEIKNPLQAITVHLEVLKSKLIEQYDDVGPAIETIAREIQRLDRVVKTFLDFTRPVDLRMGELEMVGLAREVVKLVEPSAARQSVTVEFSSDPDEVYVHGDRDLIQQAILNVVVNGVESMKQGGRLAIRCEQRNEECVVSISDQGVGIPPEIRDKIFNLYYSTKGKGSGIGLAMTFRVVQLHNGTIDFSSEPGRGTTFRLRFPTVAKGETSPLTGGSPNAIETRA